MKEHISDSPSIFPSAPGLGLGSGLGLGLGF